MDQELATMDATAQADLVRTGQASPLELVDAAIERIEAGNPTLNAVIHTRFEQARSEAQGDLPDGPFRGVPFLLKDLDGYSAGDPYHGGNRATAEAGYVAPADSYLTTKFREAGLVILGRTNTPEFGLLPSTEPLYYGPTLNPWDHSRSAGGSSGGSAASVAAGFVPMAHAGDGGGSIRIPSSFCGLVGLIPSRGRHSLGPEAGESWGGFVRRMALTRTVRDCAATLDAISGAMPGDPYTAPPPVAPFLRAVGSEPSGLRVGFTTQAGDPNVTTDPACVAAVERTAAALSELGHEVSEARPGAWDDADAFAAFTGHFITAFGVWTAAELDRAGRRIGRDLTPDDVEEGTWAVAEPGRGASALDYLAAIEYFHDATRDMATFWADPARDPAGRGFDLLLTPTVPEPAPTLGQFHEEGNPFAGLFRASSIVPFVAPFNVTGQPAMSLPVHTTDAGLPIGVQLVADHYREDVLIAVASQLESSLGFRPRGLPASDGT